MTDVAIPGHHRGSCQRAQQALLPQHLCAAAQHRRLGCGDGGTPGIGAAGPPRCLPAQWISTLAFWLAC